jgi:hypothetical protein
MTHVDRIVAATELLDLRQPARQITFSREVRFLPTDLGERLE